MQYAIGYFHYYYRASLRKNMSKYNEAFILKPVQITSIGLMRPDYTYSNLL